jgi:alpha/beta hydrolase family protein
LPAIAEAGFRAVAPDLRGFGESDRPLDVADDALPRLVADVTGLIRALGVERAHLVGHDWGRALAWAVAARAPEAVRSLTILNRPHPTVRARERLENPAQQRMSWYMLLFRFEGVAVEWLAADEFREPAPGGYGTAAPGALPIVAPTLIVWGEEDAYLGLSGLERSLPMVSGPLRVERLPGVSHWMQSEAPEVVNRPSSPSLPSRPDGRRRASLRQENGRRGALTRAAAVPGGGAGGGRRPRRAARSSAPAPSAGRSPSSRSRRAPPAWPSRRSSSPAARASARR